jgi:hypothetical protein
VRNRIAHRWLKKPWFAALLLTAFFSRALIPIGFMPGPGGLILCSGYAAVPSNVDGAVAAHDMPDMPGMDMGDMDMSTHASPPGHGDHSPDHDSMGVCPYAAAAAVLAITHAYSAPSGLLPVAPPLTTFPPEIPLPRGTIVPTSLPRGPPSLA